MRIGFIGAGIVGRTMKRHLINAGHHVVISNSRGPETLRSFAHELGPQAKAGTRKEAVQTDLVILCVNWRRAQEALQGVAWSGQILIDATNAHADDPADVSLAGVIGPIDIAVNNAGGIVTSDGELFRPFENVSDEDWLGTFELNVMSAVRVSRALAPKMAERGWGRIINISSESGVQPDPVAVEYAAAKGALNAMTKALSKAYGGRGVLVNVVSPAYIDTPIVRSVLSQMPGGDKLAPDQLTQQYIGQFRPNIVVGHAGSSEEVAAAVVFLASDAASFITGTNLRVDGGSVATV